MNFIQNTFIDKFNTDRNNTISNRIFYKNIYKEGIYYGYPKCCINSYIVNHFNCKSFTHVQLCVSAGTGFIPCIQHAENLHKENMHIHTIIRKRECPHAFPFDHDE